VKGQPFRGFKSHLHRHCTDAEPDGSAGTAARRPAPHPTHDRRALQNPPKLVSAYGQDQKLRREDTPQDLVTSLPAGAPVPQFWLGAGAGSRLDSANARVFAQLLQVRQGAVTVHLVKGRQHTMFTWRALVPSMLAWMTPRLAHEADVASAQAIAHKHHPAGHQKAPRHHRRHHRHTGQAA
jgi:hypothetical protein